VFAFTQLQAGDDAPFPGDESLELEASRLCIETFDVRFRISYESSQFDAYPISPTRDTWALGDRQVICSAARFDYELATGRTRDLDVAFPGNDIDVLSAATCADLVDMMMVNAQDTIDIADTTEDAVIASLGPNDFLPGLDRMWKRDWLIWLESVEIGCPLGVLNSMFDAQAGELEADTLFGAGMASNFANFSYWDESQSA